MHLAVFIEGLPDDGIIAARAAQQSLWLSALSQLYLGEAERRGLVLGFGNTRVAQIAPAVRSWKLCLAEGEGRCSAESDFSGTLPRHLRHRKRERDFPDKILHARTGWVYPIDSARPFRRAAAGTGRCARRMARDRTAICGGTLRNESRSRIDRDHVVSSSEA